MQFHDHFSPSFLFVRCCPRIELFARQNIEGWDCFGNEVQKKPIKVEAFQWKIDEPPSWFYEACELGTIASLDKAFVLRGYEIIIKRNEKEVNMAHAGDCVIKDSNGEVYPVKEELFKKMYEKVWKEDKI